MKRQHEQLLVAALAGIIILSGAAFAVQPSFAADAKAVPGAPASRALGDCALAPAELTQAAAPASQMQADMSLPAAGLWCRIADPEAPIGQGPHIAYSAA